MFLTLPSYRIMDVATFHMAKHLNRRARQFGWPTVMWKDNCWHIMKVRLNKTCPKCGTKL